MLGTYLSGALYFTWLNVLTICTSFLHLFSPPIISFLSNPHKKIFSFIFLLSPLNIVSSYCYCYYRMFHGHGIHQQRLNRGGGIDIRPSAYSHNSIANRLRDYETCRRHSQTELGYNFKQRERRMRESNKV